MNYLQEVATVLSVIASLLTIWQRVRERKTMRCKAMVAEEREDRQCKRTAVNRGYCQLHKNESVMVGGRWSDEACARCNHRWGNHGLAAPHKCTRKDLGCECAAFLAHAEEGEL